LTILRVRPKQVTHWSFMRDLLNAVKFPDIIE
jgi:hypothetical protein